MLKRSDIRIQAGAAVEVVEDRKYAGWSDLEKGAEAVASSKRVRTVKGAISGLYQTSVTSEGVVPVGCPIQIVQNRELSAWSDLTYHTVAVAATPFCCPVEIAVTPL